MKLKLIDKATAPMQVAPRAGAWIETLLMQRMLRLFASPPVRGRGLKQGMTGAGEWSVPSPPVRGRGLKQSQPKDPLCRLVAPRAGAWIETGNTGRGPERQGVAPRAGAWIETRKAL